MQIAPHAPKINQLLYSPNFVGSESQFFKYNKRNATLDKTVNPCNRENNLFQSAADGISKQTEQRDNFLVYNMHTGVVVSKTDSISANSGINTPLCNKAVTDIVLKTAAESSAVAEHLRATPSCEQKQYISRQANELCDPNQRNDGVVVHSHQNVNHKLQQVYCNHSEVHQNTHNFFVNKNVKSAYLSNANNSSMNGFKTHVNKNQTLTIINATAKTSWQNRMPGNVHQHNMIQSHHLPKLEQNTCVNKLNDYGKTSPIQASELSGSIWMDDARKKMKLNKSARKRSCVSEAQSRSMDCQELHTDVDIQCGSSENESVTGRQLPPHNHYAPSPSFMDDPSGYLAQQTALLNNTINRQTSKFFIM